MNRARLISRQHLAVLALVLLRTVAAAAADPEAARDAQAGPAPAASKPVALLPGRPLPSRLAEPPAVMQLQRRLDEFNAAGTPGCEEAYASYKAQAWLNFALYGAQNDVPAMNNAAALTNAGEILRRLETHARLSQQNAELPKSRHEREDLWRTVTLVKHDGRLCAAPKMTAFCEVQLAWVGYEATAGGWRHLDPYIRIAEDYCSTAGNAPASPFTAKWAEDAPAVREEPTLVADAAAPPADSARSLELAPEEKAAERIDLAVFVLFPHNRAGRGDIRPPGKLQLARIARHLKALPEGTLIEVVGHADITGYPGYNQALSARRARTVASELRMQGVDAARIQIRGVGSAEPVVRCPPVHSRVDKSHYFSCLEPNRRVVVRLVDEAETMADAAADAQSRSSN